MASPPPESIRLECIPTLPQHYFISLQPHSYVFWLKRFKYCKMYQLMRSKEEAFLVK